MLLSINDYLKKKNIKLTKRNLYSEKVTILKKLEINDFGPNYVEGILKDCKVKFFIYCSDNQILGIVIIKLITTNKNFKKYVITLLAIKKNQRGKGHGQNMINLLFNKLKINKKITIIYVHSVRNSLNFYLKNHFVLTDDYCDFLNRIEDINDDANILKYVSSS